MGVDRYKILETLGQGGMGMVQRVQDSWIGREIALKKIRSSTTSLSQEQSLSLWRFHREAAITSSLEHPNIIPLHDIQMDANEDLYFTMRKVEGETLNQLLKKKREGRQAYEEHQILGIFFKVCDAVAYAHSRGIIHRDLKPDNIMVGKFGEVYVMDWGIAKKLSEENTLEDSVRKPSESTVLFTKEIFQTIGGIGTPGYMAPEQAENASDVSFQADIYSLGRILRQCYILMDPYEEFKELINFHKEDLESVKRAIPPWEHLVPTDIGAIIAKATKTDPKERYVSVSQLTEDILRYQRYGLVSSKKYTLREVLNKWFLRHKKNLLWVAIPVLILSLSYLYFQWLLFSQKQEEITSAQIEAQQALERVETEDSIKMEKLLATLHLLTRVLSLYPRDESLQKYYALLNQKLIDLACQSQNYVLAESIFHSFQTLSLETPEKMNVLAEKIAHARDRVLQKHQEQLKFWKEKLTRDVVDSSLLLQAVLEISQMNEQKMIQSIRQELQSGTRYFLDNTETSPEQIQFFNTMVKASGEIEHQEISEALFSELKTMAKALSSYPQGQVPKDAHTYLVNLAQAVGLPKNRKFAEEFFAIRLQMGEHSCFWDQTVSSWQKLTQHIKNKSVFVKENVPIHTKRPEVESLEEGLRLKKQGAIESAILFFSQAIEKNKTYAFAYYHRALCFVSQQKWTEALQDFSECLQINPYFIEAYLERGAIYQHLQSWPKAFQDITAVLDLDPKNIRAYEMSAFVRKLQGDSLGANQYLKEVLHLKKSAFLQSPQFFELRKSEADVQEIDFLKQEDVSWLLALGQSSLENQQEEYALKVIKTVLQLQPENVEAILLRAQCLTTQGSLDLALQEYEKILSLERNHPFALTQRARIWQKKQAWENAKKDYAQALEFYPKESALYEERGLFLEQQGEAEAALKDYTQAILLNEKNVNAYLRRGFIFQSQGNLEKALADYNRVLEYDPENPEGYAFRGQIYFSQKKYLESLEEYEKALLRNPKLHFLLLSRGQSWDALGKPEKAFEDYATVLIQNPEEAEAYYLRGSLYEKSGDLEKSASDYEKAIQYSPKNTKYLTARGRLFWKQKDFVSADTILNAAIALNQREWESHYFLGKIFQEEKHWNQALIAYDRVIEIFPQFSLAYLERGRIKETQGNREEAIADYEKAIHFDRQQKEALERLSFLKSGTLNVDMNQMIDLYTKTISLTPDNAETYLKRGVLFQKQGKTKEALDDYNTALRINDRLSEAYYWRGVLRQEKYEWKQALEDYEKALKEKDPPSQIYWRRGKIYQHSEKWEKAKEDFRRSIQAEVVFGELYESLAEVCLKLNQLQEAIEYYQESIELSPEQITLFLKKGQLLILTQQWADAIEILDQGLRIDPEFPEILDAIGWAKYQLLRKNPNADHLLWSDLNEKKSFLDYWNRAIQKKESQKKEVPAIFYYHRGVFLKNTGDVDQGFPDLKLATQKEGTFAEAQNELGIALYCYGEFEKAIKACDQAIALKPSFSLAYYYRGLIYKAIGPSKIGKTLENYEKAILSHSRFGENHFEQFKNGSLQNHVELCDKKLIQSPFDPKNYADRGHLFKRMKKAKESLLDFEVFFFLAPEFQEYRHPYHSPKFEFKDFTYKNATIHSNGTQSYRIHEYRHHKTEMEFSLIPEGVFLMGSSEEDIAMLKSQGQDPNTDWKMLEQPQRFIVLKPFLLSKTEVTVSVWDKNYGLKSSTLYSKAKPEEQGFLKTDQPNYPVAMMTWIEAKNFCKKLNLALPSESQWEYACRGGTNTLYPFAPNETHPEAPLVLRYQCSLWKYACFSDNSQHPHLVIEQREANGFGLYDMLGNLFEWCEDVYVAQYDENIPVDGSPWGNAPNELHVYRGGAWESNPRQCRPAYRIVSKDLFKDTHQARYYIGFRLCRNVFD